jgi:hypothetical protein
VRVPACDEQSTEAKKLALQAVKAALAGQRRTDALHAEEARVSRAADLRALFEL